MEIKELSEKLSVSYGTLRSWEKDFNISVPRGERNRRRYDSDIVNIFETIKNLKNEKRGYDTIVRTVQETDSSLQKDDIRLQETDSKVQETNSSLTVLEKIEDRITKTITENNELSEKYAKATYKIGELEATNKFLIQEKDKLKEKIKLLPDPEQHTEIKTKNELLEKRIKELKEENDRLKLPWWKKLFSI